MEVQSAVGGPHVGFDDGVRHTVGALGTVSPTEDPNSHVSSDPNQEKSPCLKESTFIAVCSEYSREINVDHRSCRQERAHYRTRSERRSYA